MAVTDCPRCVLYKWFDARKEWSQRELERAWGTYLETVQNSLNLCKENRGTYNGSETMSWEAVRF
jgi:hypothetical protein